MNDVSIGGLRVKPTGEQVIANYIWDSGTLSWVPQTQASGGGGTASDVNVTNSVLLVEKPSRRLEADVVSPTLVYIGECLIGGSSSSAVWRISKIDTTLGASVKFAGSGGFNQIWDDRAFLTYS